MCLIISLLCRGETPTLYTVIPEKTASVGAAMMGSSHVYELGVAAGAAAAAAAAAGATTKKVSIWTSSAHTIQPERKQA